MMRVTMPASRRPEPATRRRATQASAASSAIFIGVGKGLHSTGLDLLSLTLGCGAGFEHFGRAFITAAFREHGAAGGAAALLQLTTMLQALTDVFTRTQRQVARAAVAGRN